jgi:hypothetical protein
VHAISNGRCLLVAGTADAFLEDICLPRRPGQGALSYCIRPNCPGNDPNRACPAQTADFATIKPGRSMIHADSTYFIAQALGYRADVAYWVAAYDEVTDYGQYIPIDQCGVQASGTQLGCELHQHRVQAELVGTIVSGTAYSRAEVYKSGVVTLPLQQTNAMDRLRAMNAALGNYSDTVRKRSTGAFVPFEPMPGNSFDANNTSVCWK